MCRFLVRPAVVATLGDPARGLVFRAAPQNFPSTTLETTGGVLGGSNSWIR